MPCCLIKTNSREKFPRIASGLLFWKSSQVMKESRNCCINLQYKSIYKYRTRAIITRGLYIYYPMFEGQFFVFKGVFFRKFCPYVWLVFKSGLWWRAYGRLNEVHGMYIYVLTTLSMECLVCVLQVTWWKPQIKIPLRRFDPQCSVL